MNSLPEGYAALVIGASGAIGSALVQALQADPRCARVHGWSRNGSTAVDLLDEASIATAAAALHDQGPLHLVVCATGVLQLDGHAPEKRLADLDPALLARAYAVNAIGPALLIKHLHDLLPTRERALFGVLSARVGSIGDNRKGGWYGYRASKAALNMLLRTAAIEVARRRPLAVLVALHPGTVRSGLSSPIIGNAEAASPEQAARHLLAVLDALPAEGASGTFAAWDGSAIVW
ncbi:MAG: SDR family NAD(P)-dependent oxidoreductase [Pseudomonadota bacterium]|nr:SDR family NAD(P)-dependent oxidoreductase [Pseudomonadota bacterium]